MSVERQIIPVILSGGAGTRLWPLSRELYPKQLLPLVGEQTMLQETVARLDGLGGVAAPVVVCNDAHRFLVAEQLRQSGHEAGAILLEPVGRNTAPAVALAAHHAVRQGADPLLLVLPADHVIKDRAALHTAVECAVDAAEEGCLLTFGIVPTAPETGYGYIRRSAESGNARSNKGIFDVLEFVEKPDMPTAQRYLDSGDYYWNSGMFLFRASVFLEELQRHAPEIGDACRAAWATTREDLDFLRVDSDAFAACPADSIDYAVMERTTRAAVVPLDAGWSDVGSWAALWEVGPRDASGNLQQGDVIVIDSADCHFHADSRLVAGVGLQDVVVVETADAVLVADKKRVQDVKRVVETLQQAAREEHLLHRRVNRPWGAYEGLDSGDGFLVKRITVNPGASLSLQRHRCRAEHWVVVRGTAKVTCGERVLIREANESVYIPIGEKHRLENPGEQLLEIIEVQTGNYLAEDDIERFDDEYGR